MAVDIDGVLEAIGEVGPYQRRIYFLLCLPIIFVGAANLAYVFIAAAPQYRCFIAGCDSTDNPIYDEPFLNYSIPLDKHTGDYDSCQQYVRKNESYHLFNCSEDDFSNRIKKCDAGMVFDTSIYESTIISEFNLTCRESWEASADQAVYFGGMLVGALVFGILSDMFGRRKTILVGIVFMSTSGITIALVPNLFSFHVLRFLNAMSSSGLFQTAFILGLEFVGPKKRVMFGVIGEYFFALGEVLLGLVAWAIRSWRMLQIVISAPVTCFMFYYWVVPESIRWLQAKGRHAQVVVNLENIARINKKTIPLHLLRHQPIEESQEDDSDDLTLLINRHHQVTVWSILKHPTMLLRLLFMIIIWITTTLTYYGLSYNAMELGAGHGANKPYINFILSALVEIPGYTIAWIGMEYWGRKWSLMSTLLLSGCACIATGYLEGFTSMILLFLVGKCNITSAFAIIYVYTAEMFPTNVRNTIIGTCSMFARVGGMIAPFSTSLKSVYPPLPLLLFGSFSLLSSLLTLIMPETLNTKLPDSISDAINLGKRNVEIDSNENEEILDEEERENLLGNSSVDDTVRGSPPEDTDPPT